MKRIVNHIIVPAILPVAFFIIAITPVEVLGCRRRGLLALLIAFISGAASSAAAIKGAKKRMRGETSSVWWIASSMVLSVPVIALIILA
jgi:hypothetical protein